MYKQKSCQKYILAACFFIMILYFCCIYYLNNKAKVMNEGNKYELYSSQVILKEIDTGRIIFESSSDMKVYPASLTKIMTAIISIEYMSEKWNDIYLRIPEGMNEEIKKLNASTAGFEDGEVVTGKDLVYGLMLESGADAAKTLAIYLAGSEMKFVTWMNDKAEKLNMKNTKFKNVTGLHEKNHYSTVEDLSILLEYALKNKNFRIVFTSGFYQTNPTNIHVEGMTLESTMFKKLSISGLNNCYILGGKTGYTPEAGLCLATLAYIKGNEYILITTGAKASSNADNNHLIDAMKIYKSLGGSP